VLDYHLHYTQAKGSLV